MIRLVEALGYKCLKRVWAPLSDFQILVGPNASGKSAFLDVIALLGDLVRDGVDAAIQKRGQRFGELAWKGERNWFAFAIEVKLPGELSSKLKEKHKDKSFPSCRYEVTIGLSEGETSAQILGETLWLKPEEPSEFYSPRRDSSFRGKENADQHQLRLFEDGLELESAPPERGHAPSGWRKTVNKVLRGSDYFISETTGWNAPFRIGPRKMALANLPEEEDRFPVSIWVKRLLLEGISVISLRSEAMRRPCSPLVQTAPFAVDGGNLPLVVRRLKEKDKVRFRQWLDHLRTALPDLADIDVVERPEDRHLYLNVNFANGLTAPSWTISDGTLRIMALTLLAYLPEQERIFLIEEPENGVHPKAVETVFQSLSSAYQNQILVATHSPVILSVANPEQVICFRKDEEGATRLIAGDKHPSLRSWQGEENLGVLYAAGVLD